MKLRIFLFSALTLIAFSCKPGFKTSPNGLTYKIISKGKGDKPKLNDVLKFHFMMKNEKDSIIFSSYKSGEPRLVQLHKPMFKGDPMEGFAMMVKGDSAVFKLKADSFFKGAEENPFKKGETMTLFVKMLDIKSYADYMKDMQKMSMDAQQKEDSTLEKLIKDKYPTAKKTESGMYYIITKPGTGPNAQKGDSVSAHYRGMFTNGKLFDTDSGRNESFKFRLGLHQVISGWDEGFTYLNKGAKATFIIPSKLAYGPRGNQGIPPASTLIFDVELLNIEK